MFGTNSSSLTWSCTAFKVDICVLYCYRFVSSVSAVISVALWVAYWCQT